MSGLSGRALYPDEPKQAEAHLAYKDAIFLSPHKFAGGPGSSGVLLAKKKSSTTRSRTSSEEVLLCM